MTSDTSSSRTAIVLWKENIYISWDRETRQKHRTEKKITLPNQIGPEQTGSEQNRPVLEWMAKLEEREKQKPFEKDIKELNQNTYIYSVSKHKHTILPQIESLKEKSLKLPEIIQHEFIKINKGDKME